VRNTPLNSPENVGEVGAILQQTLQSNIHCKGISLHSGAPVAMVLRPAKPNTGIVFRRTDVPGKDGVIPAIYSNVSETLLGTTIANNAGVSVATIEHLMAAFAGCDVDNAIVELDGVEVPIMDGSAEPFVELIEHVGTVEQDAPRRVIRVLKPVTARFRNAMALLEPSPTPTVRFEIAFDNPLVGTQEYQADLSSKVFKKEISRARTFGFLEDVEAMRKAGFAQGGSLDNAVVVSGKEILNDGGLRYVDEFVRHKVLDCIGDLYLAGAPIIGAYTGSRAGHCVNNMLLRALMADESAWIAETFTGMPVPPAGWATETAVA
jgi:UDP-3-O-[3-hydroxymyristoyl] N-acetylglucosamine deacetylase